MSLTSAAAALRGRDLQHHPPSSLEFGAGRCSLKLKRSLVLTSVAAAAARAPAKKKSFKSWVRRTEKFMKPFSIDVFVSRSHVSAKVVHRVTSRTVASATTASRELRDGLPSRTGESACETIGRLVAERSIEADVYAVAFTLGDIQSVRNVKVREKIRAVLDSVERHGVVVLHPKEYQAPDKPTLSDCLTDYY